MRYFLLLLLPLLLLSEPFKVASYNVENLFDAEYAGTEYEAYTHRHHWNQGMVEIKLNHVAEVICDLDADIIGLQEIENADILLQLQKRLSRVGCKYRYSAITSKKNAPIQVALLSRFRINATKEIVVNRSAGTRNGTRNILEVKVDVKGHPLWIFVNHWKSRAYKGYESKRLKYAKALKKRLEPFPKSKPYILMGDFNTEYDAHLGLEKRINDTQGKTGLHHILAVSRGSRLVDEASMLKGEEKVHYTLWQELPLEERWSTKFYGKKGTADHILLPSSMFDKKGIEYVNNSFKVFKKGYLFTKQGYIHRWQYKKGRHRGKGYSDHLPIYAYFDLKPYHSSKEDRVMQKERDVKKIEYFYTQKSLEHDVILKDAVVVWKRRGDAVIKQTKEGRGIYIYASASQLKEGMRYDLLVRGMKEYKGLKELTQIYVMKEKGSVNRHLYTLKQEDFMHNGTYRQNEVIESIVGRYKNRHFYVGERKIPLYFKNKKSIPPNGAKLKLHNALLGYYKKLQLVVHSAKDFKILEK